MASKLQLREVELVRLCLKHFRQQGYDSAFKALQEQTNVILEDPMMSELHGALVVQGDFQKAENFVEKAINGKNSSFFSVKCFSACFFPFQITIFFM